MKIKITLFKYQKRFLALGVSFFKDSCKWLFKWLRLPNPGLKNKKFDPNSFPRFIQNLIAFNFVAIVSEIIILNSHFNVIFYSTCARKHHLPYCSKANSAFYVVRWNSAYYGSLKNKFKNIILLIFDYCEL